MITFTARSSHIKRSILNQLSWKWSVTQLHFEFERLHKTPKDKRVLLESIENIYKQYYSTIWTIKNVLFIYPLFVALVLRMWVPTKVGRPLESLSTHLKVSFVFLSKVLLTEGRNRRRVIHNKEWYCRWVKVVENWHSNTKCPFYLSMPL